MQRASEQSYGPTNRINSQVTLQFLRLFHLTFLITPLFSHSASIVLYEGCSLSQLRTGWMDAEGEREGVMEERESK